MTKRLGSAVLLALAVGAACGPTTEPTPDAPQAACVSDASCAPGTVCVAGECLAASASVGCESARSLDLSTGRLTVSGHGDGVSGAAATDHDLWFRVTTPWAGRLALRLSPSSADVYAALALNTADCAYPLELARAAHDVEKGYAEIEAAPVQGATSYLVRLVHGSRLQGFTLEATLDSDAGLSCSQPYALTLDAAGTGSLSSATVAGHQAVVACNSIFYDFIANRAYEFELPQFSKVSFTAKPLSPELMLSLSPSAGACGEMKQVQCSLGASAGQTVTHEGYLPAGTNTLLVLSLDGEAGPFQLDVAATPWSSNDTCDRPLALAFTGGQATVQGDARLSRPGWGQCARGELPHRLVYRFSTVGLGERAVKVEAVASDVSWTPRLGLSRTCGSGGYWGDQQRCDDNGSGSSSARIEEPRLPEGEYFLEVTSTTEAAGPFALSVTLSEPAPVPVGDSCDALPPPLDFTQGALQLTLDGSTATATHDAQTSCGTMGSPYGRDLVYGYRLPGRGRLLWTLTPQQPWFDPVLNLQVQGPGTTCSMSAFGCTNQNGHGEPEVMSTRVAYPEGWVIVDGADQGSGDFVLQGTYVPPPPHDTCGTHLGVASVPFTLQDTMADAWGPYEYGSERDLYYRFRVTQAGSYRVRLEAPGFDAYLRAGTSCTDAGVFADDSRGPGVEELTVTTPKGSSTLEYTVTVTSYGAAEDFTLSVEKLP